MRATLVIESYKDNRGGVGSSFHWDAFGIEGMVGRNSRFQFWWGCRPWDANTWCWGWQALSTELDPRATWGHLALGLPCLYAGSNLRA